MWKIIGTLSLFLVNPCWAFDFDGGRKSVDIKTIIKESASAIPSAVIKPDNYENQTSEVKEWTVMVFVNAKNNLESYGLSDVNEMEMVGSTDKINIVVELGRITGYSSADGDWKGCRRYYVTKDDDKNRITSPVISENPKCDMGNWEYLADFANWARKNYPAKKYILIVWNHGSGWDKGGNISEIIEKGISYDDETRNHITTPQLRMALEKIGKIDILAMDACLMQMVEVAYEVKELTDYVVASEETEPADGYTYNTWLKPLTENPEADAKTVSKYMVDSYTDHYQSINQGATQSAIDVSKLARFRDIVDGFIKNVIEINDNIAAKNARTNAQKFYYSNNKDMYHFVKLVYDYSQSESVKTAAGEVLKFMKEELIVHNRAYGSKYSNAYGLAVWVPTYYSTSYDELMWAKDSGWDEFIKWIK